MSIISTSISGRPKNAGPGGSGAAATGLKAIAHFAPAGNPAPIYRIFRRLSFDIGLAKWQEARLLEAEILLARGEVGNAVALVNEVRAAAGLAPVSSSLTAAQAEAALRTERKHELFMEGQRMLDMRRWGLFPQGWQASCVPIPAAEYATNPNL